MRLEELRGKYSGGKIDLIGNADNLSPRKGDSFATNLINRCYGYSSWRPTFYICLDKYMLDNYEEDVRENIAAARYAFIPHTDMDRYGAENVTPIVVKQEPFDGIATEGIYAHTTTLMAALKLSDWMGYTAVTFRNCDLYFGESLHFYPDDSMKKLSKDELGRRRVKSILAHAQMIEYCNKKGIKVRYD